MSPDFPREPYTVLRVEHEHYNEIVVIDDEGVPYPIGSDEPWSEGVSRYIGFEVISAPIEPIQLGQRINRDYLKLQVWKAVTHAGGKVDDAFLDYTVRNILGALHPVLIPSEEDVRTFVNHFSQGRASGSSWLIEDLREALAGALVDWLRLYPALQKTMKGKN